MRKSYSKIRHIQEANQKLERRVLSEKNWLSKIGDYFRGPESEEYDDEDKWAKTQKQMDDYASNPLIHKFIFLNQVHKDLSHIKLNQLTIVQKIVFFMTHVLTRHLLIIVGMMVKKQLKNWMKWVMSLGWSLKDKLKMVLTETLKEEIDQIVI
jgi:hypothetical protein